MSITNEFHLHWMPDTFGSVQRLSYTKSITIWDERVPRAIWLILFTKFSLNISHMPHAAPRVWCCLCSHRSKYWPCKSLLNFDNYTGTRALSMTFPQVILSFQQNQKIPYLGNNCLVPIKVVLVPRIFITNSSFKTVFRDFHQAFRRILNVSTVNLAKVCWESYLDCRR